MSFIETGAGRIAMPEARYILPEFASGSTGVGKGK